MDQSVPKKNIFLPAVRGIFFVTLGVSLGFLGWLGLQEIYYFWVERPESYLGLTEPYWADYPPDEGFKLLAELAENTESLAITHRSSLKDLPDQVSLFSLAREFSLTDNPTRTISPEIKNLSQLEKLVITGTRVQSLPVSLGELSSLRELILANNQLTSLPPTVGNLTNLTRFSLRNNKLKSLPPTVGNLTNLVLLDLSGNHLQELPPTIGNLIDLRILILSDNRLRGQYKKTLDRLLPGTIIYY